MGDNFYLDLVALNQVKTFYNLTTEEAIRVVYDNKDLLNTDDPTEDDLWCLMQDIYGY